MKEEQIAAPPPIPKTARTPAQVATDAAIVAERAAQSVEQRAIAARSAADQAHVYAKLAIDAYAQGLGNSAHAWAKNALEASKTATDAAGLIG